MTDAPRVRQRALGWAALLAAAIPLAAFALLRRPNHDESQYVAAAVLTGMGLLPYRDFAWLQTPLQPFAMAPLAVLAGGEAWPALRLASALLGLVALAGLYRAARVCGAAPAVALLGAGALAACDAFLFGAATARNDMLPLALFVWGLVAALRVADGRAGPRAAACAGLLFAAAAAAKLSYALPAAALGLWALHRTRRHHAPWIAAGALPVVLATLAIAAVAPHAFWFGAIVFPFRGPVDFYARHPAELALTTKAFDLVRFLALGTAPALALAWRPARTPAERLLDLMIVCGAAAAVLPTPVWRQYLIPLLVPLAVRAAATWRTQGPRWPLGATLGGFAIAGLAPSLVAPWTFPAALRDSRRVAAALARVPVTGPVVSIAPQFVAASGRPPDPRLAAGPFVYRSRGLIPHGEEAALRSAVHDRPLPLLGRPVLVGSARWHPADRRLERRLVRTALRQGYRSYRIVRSGFRLLLPRR